MHLFLAFSLSPPGGGGGTRWSYTEGHGVGQKQSVVAIRLRWSHVDTEGHTLRWSHVDGRQKQSVVAIRLGADTHLP